ncbi:uncharacterized protein LOC109714800 [Ananas comosus]|uniref:Uncharacterized protein LOC109714800 n=1 Tax=Ananas comosus TaxID=4615 RepID=A0A6P5FFM9_ANACO|nr:uncharacterized protein LOC109714800 [Ananas comosus]
MKSLSNSVPVRRGGGIPRNSPSAGRRLHPDWTLAGIDDRPSTSLTSTAWAVHRPDPDHALSALLPFWSPATSSFLLPFAEASFTLEDAHALSSLPLSGSPLLRPLSPSEHRLRLRLLVEREKILHLHPAALRSRRVPSPLWLRWFLHLADDPELRHLGFLAYWLTLLVLPLSPRREIPARAFAIAARLSAGDRIALAQIATANVYRDLNRIASAIRAGRGGRVEVSAAPFGLLQAWVWERFASLRPPPPRNLVYPLSRARIVRWSKRRRVTTTEEALRVFRDGRCFVWRPYSENGGNWKEPDWYSCEPEVIHVEKGAPDWFPDFLAVVSPSTLVGFFGDGLISSEEYRPYRVARQFGYDQAVPESSKKMHALGLDGSKIYVPSITRCGETSADYIPWWNKFIETCQKEDAACKSRSNGSDKRKGHEEENERENIGSVTKELKENDGNRVDHMVPKHSVKRRKSETVEFKREAEKENINLDFDVEFNVRTPSVPDKRSEVVIIDDSEEESADCEGEDQSRRLVEELEEFVRRGLLTEWEPSSPEADEKSSGRDKTTTKRADPYGSEAIRMYPRFFELIPQDPHYRGLLSSSVGEDVRRDVYLAKWYRLVELMRLALKTSWDTDPLEIEKLLREARKLEQFGFNVRHLIARLREPQARVERLEKARRRLEEAQRTEKEARDVKALSSHISELESKLRSIEKKLDESRQAIGLIQQDKLKRPINMEYLKREVEVAEENLRAMKRGCSVYENRN